MRFLDLDSAGDDLEKYVLVRKDGAFFVIPAEHRQKAVNADSFWLMNMSVLSVEIDTNRVIKSRFF